MKKVFISGATGSTGLSVVLPNQAGGDSHKLMPPKEPSSLRSWNNRCAQSQKSAKCLLKFYKAKPKKSVYAGDDLWQMVRRDNAG